MSRANWTDERLDDFARNTDRRFDEVVQRMDSGFNRVNADLRELRSRIDSLQRIMLQMGGGMIATIAVGFAGLIITQA